MSGRPGPWQSHARAESSTSLLKSETEIRSDLWDLPAAFHTPYAVDYGSGTTTNGVHHTLGQSSTSGIGSSSTMSSAAPGPATVNGDVKGKGKAPDVDHDMPLLNAGGLPSLAPTTAPFPSSNQPSDQFANPGHHAPSNYSLNRGGLPPLTIPGFMIPFPSGHHSSGPPPSAPFGDRPRMGLPSFFGPQNPGHGGPTCRCPSCSSASQAMGFQQQLAKQQASINAVWDEERTRLEACRSRVEHLIRQEGMIILDHYRRGWDEERDRLQYEIAALRTTIKGLEGGHLQLCEDHRRLWVENLKLQEDSSRLQEDNSRLREDNSRLRDVISDPSLVPREAQGAHEGTAVHPGNVEPVSTNPSELAASGQGDAPSGYNGGWTAPFPPSASMVRSLWTVQAPTRATSRSPPPPAGASASQGPELPHLPSERCVSMSPQPEYGPDISSPVLSLYRNSPVPFCPPSPTQLRPGSPIPFCPASPTSARLDSPIPFCPASPTSGRLESPIPFCPASPAQVCPESPIPTRSPKRPLSVIDFNEVDAGLEGISLGANTVRRTTFARGISEGAPPSKRQRSLSQEYCIVSNVSDDDDEEDDGGRDNEEVRRLKMHAGHTPPRSPPARHSQGSPTPIASSSPPERKPAIIGGAAMAGSLHSASEDSGDVPLEGPLMIQNKPAEDESFLAALNEKLEPISQGVDALPRAVQPSTEMPAPLSAVRGERIGIRRDPRSEGTNVSSIVSTEDRESDKIRIYLGENIALEHEVCVKIEQASFPIKAEDVKPSDDDDDDDDSSDDAKGAEPELPIKFKSTSNFGAPFGRV